MKLILVASLLLFVLLGEAYAQDVANEVKFFLYDDSGNTDSRKEIRYNDANSLRQIRLNGNRRVKIYIHGFRDNTADAKAQLIKNVYLRNFRNQPVILVDWESLAAGRLTYDTVCSQNVPRVASLVRQFISNMRSSGVISSFDQIHLMGHSLGGQMSGLVGQEIQQNHGGQKLARITGMDPAGPAYEDFPPEKRLDETDANFVDVVHTDGILGYWERCGHADFFPNVGVDHPGPCPGFSCNHNKAVNYFAKSIYNRSMYGCRMVQGENASKRSCTNDCNSNVVFGEHINEGVRGVFCFLTNSLEK